MIRLHSIYDEGYFDLIIPEIKFINLRCKHDDLGFSYD